MLYSDTFFLAAREKKPELQMERIRAMYLPQTRGQENGTCEKGLHHGPAWVRPLLPGGGGGTWSEKGPGCDNELCLP